MKKKMITAGLLALCVLSTACGTEKNLSDAQQTADNAKQEEESKADNSESTDTEGAQNTDASVSESMDGFEKDETQSFTVTLNPLGEVTFTTMIPTDETSAEDARFLIEKNGSTVQTLDDSYVARPIAFSKVEAVSFTDYNKDGFDDIIIIASYHSTDSMNAGDSWDSVKYYKGGSDGQFTFEELLSQTANGMVRDFAIETLKEYAQDNFANFDNETSGGAVSTNPDAGVYRAAYQTAMQKFVKEHIYPTGDKIDDAFIENDDFSSCNFAVTDIDNDGIEELLIEFGDSTMAGMSFSVYQYNQNTDDYTEELLDFPAVEFYDNGYATVGASHNQGMAGDFWPYAVYEYDKTSDIYIRKMYIDAWEKKTFPNDYSGNPYPDDVDTSKSGYVYYMYEDGETGENVTPVDESVYKAYVADTYGKGKKVQIDFKSITDANIAAITK